MNVKTLLRQVLPQQVRTTLNPFVESVALTRHIRRMRSHSPVSGPLVVSGYFNRPIGVGRAGQLTLKALEAAGLSPIAHDLDAGFPSELSTSSGANGVWLLHCNAPEAIHPIRNYPHNKGQRPYRIGYWVYELPQMPQAWHQISRLFDEIWVPSQFVAKAFSNLPVPVRVMPHPVPPIFSSPDPRFGNTAETDTIFRVLAAGDLRSSATRKNLRGALSIYTKAFPLPSPDTHLTVKITNSADDADYRSALADTGLERSDITLLDAPLSASDMSKLIAQSSVVLSPHRSEGFGLLLAEAFQAGTPSLATAWSGNMDFMRALDPLLIRYTLADVADESGIYPNAPGHQWAEPDERDALEKLRILKDSPALRQKYTIAGQRAIAARNQHWTREALLKLPATKYLRFR